MYWGKTTFDTVLTMLLRYCVGCYWIVMLCD